MPATLSSGRCSAGSRPSGDAPVMPVSHEHRVRAAEVARGRCRARRRRRSPTSSRGRKAEAGDDLANSGTRRLADDRRPRAGDLRERRGHHRAAAEDRAVGAGVRGDVARGQERAPSVIARAALFELGEVEVRRMSDEHDLEPVLRVDQRARLLAMSRSCVAGVQNASTPASRVPAAQERDRAADRCQHLVVADVEPSLAQLGREDLRRDMARVREDRRTAAPSAGSRRAAPGRRQSARARSGCAGSAFRRGRARTPSPPATPVIRAATARPCRPWSG